MDSIDRRLSKESLPSIYNTLTGIAWAKQRRLHRLRNGEEKYLWLAADHGLSLGALSGLAKIGQAVETALSAGFTGIVVNRGMLREIPPLAPIGVLLQTFGATAGTSNTRKRELIAPLEASKYGTDGVAVELDLSGVESDRATQDVACALTSLEECCIPALLMIKHAGAEATAQTVSNSIRVAAELGADFVKIGLPSRLLHSTDRELQKVSSAVEMGPVVLLAGGPPSVDFLGTVSLARDLGFGGVCVGRNIFQDPDPFKVLSMIRKTFET